MRYWAAILFVVLVGATVVWRAWPAPPPQAQAIASVAALHNDTSAEPDIQMIDMHLMAQIGNKTVLQVVAKHAISSSDEQQAIVHDIQAKMQQEAGRTWYLSAAKGLVDRVTGDMTAQGGVRLYEKDGYVLETENLSLHAAQQVLQTDTAVMLYGNTVLITGTGLQHEIRHHRITLQHQVKASFHYDRNQREVKSHTSLDAFNVDRRFRPFDHGTTQPEADATPGN
jgi:LPS export ABC transporter protein LptC